MEPTKQDNVQVVAHVEQSLEAASPAHDGADSKVTWRDFLAARRVIMWCEQAPLLLFR